MSDELIPPVPPAERVFKVPAPEGGAHGQESKKPSGDLIKNQNPPAGKSAKSSFLENLKQFVGKGIHLPGKHAAGAGPQSLFASPVRFQGMDSVKQLLTTGIDLDSVNKVLTGILVVLMVYAMTVAISKKSGITKLMQTISHIKFEQSAASGIEAFQPVDYYLGQVRSRDIFNPLGEVKTQVVPELLPPPAPPKPKLKEMVTGLSVVGIAWGETPKAMVQDSATQDIYFLKKGDSIGKTEIKVKDILRSKIVVSYEEEELEL